MANDSAFAQWMTQLLHHADFGIVDFKTEEANAPHFGDEESEETLHQLMFVHAGVRSEATLSLFRESAGTRKMVELAPFLHKLTHSDEPVACFLDELGASLHPLLMQTAIQFLNADTPPEQIRGQLDFATHETAVIDAPAKNAILRRDQVYITEKDDTGAATLRSLADFRERNIVNLRKRYLQGRYGGLPSIGRFGV